MDSQKLRMLLRSNETGTLEFKQEWYKIDAADADKRNRQKGELIKDILSLANGNTIVAGEEAHLIIGASDKLNDEGTRDLFDIAQTNITPLDILKIVNSVCDPPLEEVYCDTITLNQRRVIVITIPPTPHLYETTEELKTSRPVYNKYTVFVRHGEGIDTASAKEREKILKLKKIAFSERRSAPPLPFGIAVGALAGGVIASALSGEKLVASKAHWPLSGLVGIGLGAFFGGFAGYAYSSYYEIQSRWLRVPPARRAVGMGVALAGSIGSWFVFERIKAGMKRQATEGRGVGEVISTWLDSGLMNNPTKGTETSADKSTGQMKAG